MTIIFSFGPWGGFYKHLSKIAWRICLGWMAITIIPEDFDYWLLDRLEMTPEDLHYKEDK